VARMFPEYKRSTVYAVIGAVLHFSLLTLTLFLEFMGLSGENPLGYLISIWGWPLFLLPDYVHAFKTFSEFFMLYWYMGGTFLAAVEGWIVGYVVDTFLHWRLKNWGF